MDNNFKKLLNLPFVISIVNILALFVLSWYVLFWNNTRIAGIDGQMATSNTEGQDTKGINKQTAVPNGDTGVVPITPEGVSLDVNKLTVAPLAVIEEIYGNEITVKVPVVNESSIRKINTSYSGEPVRLDTSVKTFVVTIDANTRFIDVLEGELRVGGAYTIEVNKSFGEATGKLVAISIAPSNIPASYISKPVFISPVTP